MLSNNTKFAALAGFTVLLASQCPGATASPVKTISLGKDGLPAHAPGPVLLCPGFPTAGIIPIPHFHHDEPSTHSSLSPTSEA